MSGHALKHLDNVSRRDLFYVDFEQIFIIDGINPREKINNLIELQEFIATNIDPKSGNVLNLDPLRCFKLPSSELGLIGGHRRWYAAKAVAISQKKTLFLPVMLHPEVLDPGNDADKMKLLTLAIAHNSGLPFTATEEANAFKLLYDHGVKVEDIAFQTGRSVSHIRNRLKLAEADPEVKAAVAQGEITLTDAMDGKAPEEKKEKKKNTRPYKKKRLVLSYTENNMIKATGLKNVICDPIEEVMESLTWRQKIKDAGFNPDTIKISIEPLDYEEQL